MYNLIGNIQINNELKDNFFIEIKDHLNVDSNKPYILYYNIEYSLDWISHHYGEDEIISNYRCFHSGPQNIIINSLKLNDLELDKDKFFSLAKQIILDHINQ